VLKTFNHCVREVAYGDRQIQRGGWHTEKCFVLSACMMAVGLYKFMSVSNHDSSADRHTSLIIIWIRHCRQTSKATPLNGFVAVISVPFYCHISWSSLLIVSHSDFYVIQRRRAIPVTDCVFRRAGLCICLRTFHYSLRAFLAASQPTQSGSESCANNL